MTKTRKLGVIAVATLLSALSLPRSSSAQAYPFPPPYGLPPGPVYGSWTGFETFEISVYEFGQQQPIDVFSGSGPATLTIGADFMEIGTIWGQGGVFINPSGPTSASGGIEFMDGPGGSSLGNFFVTYQSILPDGQIDVGNGTAVADLTSGFFYSLPNNGLGETIGFATFTTVPEPSSIVPAALAVLVIAVVAWMRGFCRRPRARLS
jgi:hypothetical protein